MHIKRTFEHRREEAKLLISWQKAHKRVRKDKIIRWIKQVLEILGIDSSV